MFLPSGSFQVTIDTQWRQSSQSIAFFSCVQQGFYIASFQAEPLISESLIP